MTLEQKLLENVSIKSKIFNSVKKGATDLALIVSLGFSSLPIANEIVCPNYAESAVRHTRQTSNYTTKSKDRIKLHFINHYTKKRKPIRKRTDYIILHTTESSLESTLNTLTRRGKIHFTVDTNGDVYRILKDNRIGRHVGDSMWNGVRNLDKYSIGIECVGKFNKDLTDDQYKSLKELLRIEMKKYNINDAHVLPHAAVACSYPDKNSDRYRRGRRLDARLLYI